jgi:transcriptional regulator with XRE-family HTH domain
MKLGEKIQFYRKKSGLSQEALGKSLYVTRQTVSLWEKGQSLPSLDNIIRLSAIFGITTDALLIDEFQLDWEQSAKCDANDTESSNGVPTEAVAADNAEKSEESNISVKSDKNICHNCLVRRVLIIALTVTLILGILVFALYLIFKTGTPISLSDEEIASILGEEVLTCSSRSIAYQNSKTSKIYVYAISELEYSDSLYSAFAVKMDSQIPQGVEAYIDRSYVYSGADLYLLYDIENERESEDKFPSMGKWALFSYFDKSRILIITEFEVLK